jgi:thymidylate synthase (FAD)
MRYFIPQIEKIPVLDKGYVRYVDCMGTDLSVVNAARVSYDKESQDFVEADQRLLNFLIREGHTSPFRHAFMTFEISAPLVVTRQWEKYIVGSDHTMDGRNESSRRYVTSEPEFYIPTEWRSAPENSKQGSGDPILNGHASQFTEALRMLTEESIVWYERLMEAGVCAEQARLFLPAYSLYVKWRWSCSLQSVLHFLNQRLAPDAQSEIQQYAKAVEQFVKEAYPKSYEAWNEHNNNTE